MDSNPTDNVIDFAHGTALTNLCKTIIMCDMDEDIKKIMLLRVWGPDPKNFQPMTAEQVAFVKLRCKRPPTEEEVEEIVKLEETGKFHCAQFLTSVTAQDILNSFNKDFNKNAALMFSKMNYERKKFSL